MAQVNLDVVYNVKGMQALKQSQAAMNQAAAAANGGANNIRKYNTALTANGAAAARSATANAAASKGFRATGFAATSASGGVKSFGIALSAALGPIAAITGGLALVSKTIGIFSDRQRDVAVLQNGLQNLGQEGTSALDRLQASADKLGKTTLFDQEQFTRGYALLTSFQQIGVGSYERVAQAAADLAQTTGQDLNSALLQLSKALEDPARRVTDLSRSGTVFTEQQKEQIRVLQQSGNMLGAQKLILQEIEKQYGGAAEAAGSAGLAGAMDSAGESARDLGEAVGTIIVPALENFLKTITPIIAKLAQFVDLVAKIPGVLGGIQGASGGLASMFDKPKEDAKELKETLEETPEPIDKSAQLADLLATNLAAAKAESASFQATQNAALQQAKTLSDAYYQSSMQIVGAKKEAAEADLKAAQTQQQKIAAINEIYNLTVTLAKIELEQALNALKFAEQKLVVQHDLMMLKYKEIAIEVELAHARKEEAASQQRALVLASESLAIAKDALNNQRIANQALAEGAQAVYDQKIAAAEVLRQQQLQEAQQQQTNNAIAQGVGQMNQLAAAASNAAGAVAAATGGGGGGGGGGTTRTTSSSRGANNVSYGTHNGLVKIPYEMTNGRSGSDLRVKTPFGEVTWEEFMYYVENPTHGKKHYQASQEAEREEQKRIQYEIQHGPNTYQQSATSRGTSSSSALAPNVNVNYTGSTVNFGGDDYVKKSDVNGIVKSATSATMNTLRSSSGARLAAGL